MRPKNPRIPPYDVRELSRSRRRRRLIQNRRHKGR
jgi:hypothetical protein